MPSPAATTVAPLPFDPYRSTPAEELECGASSAVKAGDGR